MRVSRFFRQFGVGALVVAVASGGGVLLGGLANAAPPSPGSLGTLAMSPSTGDNTSIQSGRTSAPCAAASDGAYMAVTGPVGDADPTFPSANPFNITTAQSTRFSTATAFTVEGGRSMQSAATNRGKQLKAGRYDFTVVCVNTETLEEFGNFRGAIYFTGPTAWQAADPSGGPTPTPVVTPTPVPVVTPSPVPVVTPSPVPVVTPSPVPVVTPSPVPVVTPSPVPVVTPSPVPVVTPSPVPTQGPTPTPAPGVKATTTTLRAVSRGLFPGDGPVTLIASVTPRNAAGTVQFKDGNTNIGNPVIVINGTAFAITSTSTIKTNSLTAVFTPTDTTKFSGSTSPPVSLTVTPPIIAQLQLFFQFLQSILGGLHF